MTRWIIIAALTLSACSEPEAPEWLTEYQETGKTCADRPEGCTEDPPGPDTLSPVDDTTTPDVEAAEVQTSEDTATPDVEAADCDDEEIPCNGVDDDCDPLTLDDACAQPESPGQFAACVNDACQTADCDDGVWNVDGDPKNGCEYLCSLADDGAIDATCDGIDDDCDGQTDEDFVSVDTTCGLGACEQTGATSCEAGEIVDDCMAAPPTDDTNCNNIDDDCDGETDEHYPSVPCDGNDDDDCASGWTQCFPGEFICMGDDGLEKECNGHDDDCDGVIDECAQPDLKSAWAACNDDTGACEQVDCAPNTQNQDGDPENSCEVTCQADGGDATCDGVDDDCDGETDEDTDPSSDPANCGSCGMDCDTLGADLMVEAWSCVNGLCAVGTCEQDAWDINTDGEDGCEYYCFDQGAELCNEGDDDCDGGVDEDFQPGGTETLDGLSLDAACGVGACANGTVECVEGGLGCSTAGEASDELCNGIDDDCDGQTDEDFPTKDEACDGDDPDSCASGTWKCTPNFTELFCDGDNGNAEESCDGDDNDCDDKIDETFDLQIDVLHCGVCGHGCAAQNPNKDVATWACQAGACSVETCDPGYWDIDAIHTNGCEYHCTESGAEVCDGGGVDEDCDGQVDEGFDLLTTPEQCGACGHDCATENPGVSVVTWACDAGTCAVSTCDSATHDLNGDGADGCEYACEMVGEETCDGFDEDCDGEPDEGQLCDSVGSDTLSACDGGECKATACDPNTWDLDGLSATGCEYACEQLSANDQTCDGVDDDCDGEVDDDGTPEGEPCPPADTEVVEIQYNGQTSSNVVYCARRQDGSVWCWGSASYYVASGGVSNSGYIHTPRYIPVEEPVVDIAINRYVGAAAGESGKLWLWGLGYYGLAGDGVHHSSSSDKFTPTALVNPETDAPFVDITSTSLATNHGCIRRENQEIWCWGKESSNGATGPGSGEEPDQYWRPTPLRYTEGGEVVTGIIDSCLASNFGCAIVASEDGNTTLCWGHIHYTGRGTNVEKPEEPGGLINIIGQPFTTPLVTLSCSSDHTCGLDAEGQAYCWGEGSSGQVGKKLEDATWVVQVPSGAFEPTLAEPLVSLTLKANQSCGRTEAGDLYCWGNLSEYGGGATNRYATKVEENAPGATPAGSCQLHPEGHVSCQGFNTYGQLAQGDATYQWINQPDAVLLPEVKASDLAGDSGYSMCIIDADASPGQVHCWRTSTSGHHEMLANGTSDPIALPDRMAVLGDDDLPIEASELEAGYGYSTYPFFGAILTNGDLVTWGQTGIQYGMAGHTGSSARASRVIRESDQTPLADGSALSLGYTGACAVIGESQEVWCWGGSGWGGTDLNLGLNSFAQPIPTSDEAMPFLAGAVDVSVSKDSNGHGCAVIGTPDAQSGPMGEVWCWGDNSANALGTASEESPIYVASPVLHWETYQPLSGMKAVTAMRDATCAISADEDASIFCWGADNHGQMGNDGLPAYDFAAPTGAMTHPDMLTAWDTHYCGLKGGFAACWGSNSSGQTGLGSTTGTEHAPTTVDGLPALRSVHAIYQGTCFITEDYTVGCAGSNSNDRFGQGIYYSPDYLDVIGLDGPIPE